MPNRLTFLYSKNYYKKENYLKVKTVVFKYITPPYSKGLSILVHWYTSVLNTLCTHIFMFQTSVYTKFYYMTWLPLILWLYWFH